MQAAGANASSAWGYRKRTFGAKNVHGRSDGKGAAPRTVPLCAERHERMHTRGTLFLWQEDTRQTGAPGIDAHYR